MEFDIPPAVVLSYDIHSRFYNIHSDQYNFSAIDDRVGEQWGTVPHQEKVPGPA